MATDRNGTPLSRYDVVQDINGNEYEVIGVDSDPAAPLLLAYMDEPDRAPTVLEGKDLQMVSPYRDA